MTRPWTALSSEVSGMKNAALLLVLLVLPALAIAQETPPPPEPTPPAPRFSGKGELSFVSTSGNTSTQTLGFGAEAVYAPMPWSFGAKLAYVRAEADDELKAKSFAATVRADRKLVNPFEVFVEGRYLSNTFAGFDNRWSADAGVAWTFFKTPEHLLKTELALGYTQEARVTGEDLNFATARVGLFYSWKISTFAEFTDESYYLADLSDRNNWRFNGVSALTANVTTVVSLKATLTVAYVKKPPPGFETTDRITSVALVAKF
jgi:putative salt-induced outer membrane protein